MISVITINKNNAKGLEKTLESLKDQANKNFELIIIDGMSSDNSVAIINSLTIEGCKSLKKIIEKDTGVFDAMNKGITFATQDYIMFLNSGDYFINTESYNQIYKELHRFNDINYFPVRTIMTNGKVIDLNNKRWPVHQGVVMKTSLLKSYMFDSNLKILGDLDLWYRLLKNKRFKLKKFNSITVEMILDGLGSSKKFVNQRIKDKKYLFKKHKKLRDLLSILKMKL